ncbi:MAG: tRNA (N6-threonylcarbamoyladenosine(37)-N6)-methyltransferase TrmO [Desulfuromonas sp.]|nr:MAG: tRNA (N6-threonylcarbamoyladenosine(37)-N6)-methyltransferase TrmO [Desulfuromonas sp.]
MPPVTMEPIGIIHSPFEEKFTTPRQPGLASAATGFLELFPPCNRPEAWKGIEQYSHLWLMFLFHLVPREEWQPTVRPPRLGGNERVGVFASRSPYRPNRIGLSAVKNHGMETRNGRYGLLLGGIDMVDQTPVLDIKPYLPYTDSHPEASAGRFQQPPQALRQVRFDDLAEKQLECLGEKNAKTRRLIEQVLSLDPRPGYRQREKAGEFGVFLAGQNVRWREEDGIVTVIRIDRADKTGC